MIDFGKLVENHPIPNVYSEFVYSSFSFFVFIVFGLISVNDKICIDIILSIVQGWLNYYPLNKCNQWR
jgi:hypothetical protein